LKTKDKKFSEYLQDFRNTYGFTQQQAADALGMSVRMYVAYENEEFDPKGKRLQKYMTKLNGFSEPKDYPQAKDYDIGKVSEPTAIYRENELLKDIIKAKDELIAILREQLNNLKS
jgi:transcriptional regulator with XRE-family HTH domain